LPKDEKKEKKEKKNKKGKKRKKQKGKNPNVYGRMFFFQRFPCFRGMAHRIPIGCDWFRIYYTNKSRGKGRSGPRVGLRPTAGRLAERKRKRTRSLPQHYLSLLIGSKGGIGGRFQTKKKPEGKGKARYYTRLRSNFLRCGDFHATPDGTPKKQVGRPR